MDATGIARTVDELVDAYRDRCLWFLAADYYPTTFEQRLRALSYIERYGDQAAYRAARKAREWLLRNSNETSVAG